MFSGKVLACRDLYGIAEYCLFLGTNPVTDKGNGGFAMADQAAEREPRRDSFYAMGLSPLLEFGHGLRKQKGIGVGLACLKVARTRDLQVAQVRSPSWG